MLRDVKTVLNAIQRAVVTDQVKVEAAAWWTCPHGHQRKRIKDSVGCARASLPRARGDELSFHPLGGVQNASPQRTLLPPSLNGANQIWTTVDDEM